MEIPKTARLIDGSLTDYVDIDGSIYSERTNYKGERSGKIFKKVNVVNNVHGYVQCSIKYPNYDHPITKRVHKLVAKAFIPNPLNLPIVGHKNNIKTDNRVENLYWTTWQENTQKAVDDGLMDQPSGYDDSQSKPVVMYNTYTNEKIGVYGSICEAVRQTNLSKTTIARQAKYKRPTRRPYYFRYQDDKDVQAPEVIGEFDYDTGKLINTYINQSDASKKTGVCEKTIKYQCDIGRKPSVKNRESYFNKLHSKCEQTIEK